MKPPVRRIRESFDPFRRQLIAGGASFVTTAILGTPSRALSSKPIRIIVPVAAGAANDLIGRIAADWLGKRTGLPVIVENRTGAGGNLALEQVAKAEPDGHTLLVATNGAITINPALSEHPTVNTLTDVVPVGALAQFAQLLVVNAELPAKTAQEFIALAKAKPGAINYGSAGPGSTPHLTLALFARLAGIELVHVPYRGIAPAVTDLIAGTVQALAAGYGTVAPFVESGKLRILATAGKERLAYLPEVPNAIEIGLPDWQVETWYGMFAPRSTPKAIVDEINTHILAMFDDPVTKQRFAEGYYEPMRMSADEFAERVKTDVARWRRIVRQTGIEVQ
jgi:tripartite-type tricarboxylate transporter receptor subunit TctC